VVDFNHETAQKIFRGLVKSHLLMFVSKKADNYNDIVATAAKLAATDDYRNKVNRVSRLFFQGSFARTCT
jgi:hypothetical protein